MAFNPKEKGFSLLEIVVVLSIIGLILAVAVPSLRDYYGRMQLRTTARILKSHIEYAASIAGSERVNTYVKFYPTINSYRIEKMEPGKSITTTVLKTEVKKPVSIQGTTFYQGQVFSDTLVYSTFGLPTNLGSIALQTDRGDWLWVVVSKMGRVRISPHAPGVEP